MAMTPPVAKPTKTRKKLWSQEVKEADATPDDKINYVFGNGRVFYEEGKRVTPLLSEPINE